MRIYTLIAQLLLGSLLLAPAAAYAESSVALSANADVEFTPVVITQGEVGATSSTQTTGTASAQADFEARVRAIMKKDSNISAVVLSEDAVALTYRQRAKLFGFITVHVPVRVSVHASGNTAVKYPWYSFLMATDGTALKVRTEAVADQYVGTTTKSSAAFSSDAEIRLLNALHATLLSQAGAEAD